MTQVGDYAAGNLVEILGLVVSERRTDGQAVSFGDGGEMIFDRFDGLSLIAPCNLVLGGFWRYLIATAAMSRWLTAARQCATP